MSKNYLTIDLENLDNAAFSGEDMGPEIGRILRKLAVGFENLSRKELINDDYPSVLADINGNRIGTVSGNFEEDEDDEHTLYDSIRSVTKWMDRIGTVSGNFEEDEDDEQTLYDSIRSVTKWMDRGDVIVFLADHCGVQVNDSDTDHDLVAAIAVAIDDGDCTLEDLEAFDRNTP